MSFINEEDIKMEERMMQLPESMYDKMCKTLTDFENAPHNVYEDGWLSDGEWLDVFYDLVVKIQNSIQQ
jgi:hypothetical protein